MSGPIRRGWNLRSWGPGARLAFFAAILVACFAAATGVGALGEPVDRDRASDHGGGHGELHEDANVGGLSAAAGGYRLVVTDADLHIGRASHLAFAVLDEHGERVDQYELRHEKLLHLVLARDDLSAEMHVHPQLDATGIWRIDLHLESAGRWRAIADFVPDGVEDPVALAVDLLVPGASVVVPLAPVSTEADVDDYRVEVDANGAAGEERTLEFRITRKGEEVTDLEPYLGALGHLVVLRDGDLAYLHVHPVSDDEVAFAATFPSAGTYRLYLEFQHQGTVRTAAFTMEVGE